MVTTTRMSLEDFLALPDIDDRRLELIDGEVSYDMSPTWEHGDLAFEICRILKEHGRATVEIRMVIPARGTRGDSAFIPDVAFVRREGPPIRGRMITPPHVAVEVLSPGQNRMEMRAKVDTYLAFGIESVWVVDWDRRAIDVYEGGARRTLGEEDSLESPSVPGLAARVRDIFAVVES